MSKDIKQLRRQAGAMLANAALLDDREAVLLPYGVTRLRDMSEEQLMDLISRLQALQPQQKAPAPVPESLKKARSLVLALLSDLGIQCRNGNWDQVNNYLLQPRIAGKALYAMSEEELKACSRKLRAILKQKADASAELERLQKFN